MNYAIGCAFTQKEMFENFPYKKLKITCKQCEKAIGDPHRDILARRIFRECVKLVLNDVIDNNVTFQLPLVGNVKADIHMQRFSGKAFCDLRKAGKWKDVDYLKSVFTGYQLGLFMYGKRTPRVRNIYVHKELRDKITENTNKGMQYC